MAGSLRGERTEGLKGWIGMHEGVSERDSTFRSNSGGPGSFLWEGLGLRDPKIVRGARGGSGSGRSGRPGL